MNDDENLEDDGPEEVDDQGDDYSQFTGSLLKKISGTAWALEEAADSILRASRKGVTKLSDKQDFFTEEQMILRQKREVYPTNGTPDRSVMSGLYRRVHNPQSGQRPTKLRGNSDD